MISDLMFESGCAYRT